MARRIGEAPCRFCPCPDMAVKETAGGHLSATCHKCGGQHVAPAGTASHRTLKQSVKLDASDAPAIAPAVAPAPPAPAIAPAVAPAPRGFQLANL